jgi:hypothetical protein
MKLKVQKKPLLKVQMLQVLLQVPKAAQPQPAQPGQ